MIREHADDKSINRNMQREGQRLFPFIWYKRMVEFLSCKEHFRTRPVNNYYFNNLIKQKTYERGDNLDLIKIKLHVTRLVHEIHQMSNKKNHPCCKHKYMNSTTMKTYIRQLMLSLCIDRASLWLWKCSCWSKGFHHFFFFLGLKPNICRCLHASGSVSILK